jgi:hypothetical protein
MNNQAAQTMPECTCSDNEGCTKPCDRKACQPVPLTEELLIEAAILSGDTPQERRLQKVLTQAAAALSQPAGVPAKWEVRRRFWDGAPWGPWESYETEAERTESFAKFEGSEWLHETRELYAAAPAASGGDHYNGVTQPDGSGFRHGDNSVGALPEALPKPQVANPADTTYPSPPSGASVSERARTLLADECDRAGLYEAGDGLRANLSGLDIFGTAALRALERALSSPRQEGEAVEMSPEFTDSARGAIAWVLYHHQGGSSPVGQPLRFALGMGAHEYLSDEQISNAKVYAELTGRTTAEFHTARTTPHPSTAASTQGLTDADIERALDTRVGLDHTLRQLIRGDTMAVGYTKVDVVRKLLASLLTSPTTGADGESLVDKEAGS